MDYRDKAIEMVEEGLVDPMYMLTAALKVMSQDDVKEMLAANELETDEEVEYGY